MAYTMLWKRKLKGFTYSYTDRQRVQFSLISHLVVADTFNKRLKALFG